MLEYECAREKYMLELELELWREALKKRGLKVSRAKTSRPIHVSEWNAIRSC